MNNKRRDKYTKIYESFEPFRVIKRNSISMMAGIGRNHPVLRVPILVALFVFIFIYNTFLYTCIQFKLREKLAKALAFVMTFVLTFSSLSATVWAVSLGEEIPTETIEEVVDDGDESYSEEGMEDMSEASGEDGDMTGGSDDSNSGESAGNGQEPGAGSEEPTSVVIMPEETTTEELTTEEITTEEPTTEAVIEEVTLDVSKVIDDIKISVYADKGVFPKGATLEVSVIDDDDDIEEIEQMVAGKLDEEKPVNEVTIVEKSYSYDITILDENGDEIEPDTSKGEVKVTFENIGASEVCENDDLEMNVFHVEDDLSAVEKIEEVELDEDEDSASINAEHFSIYTVVITSGEKRGTILNYYQGTNKAKSYFTIYNGEQLSKYKDLINDYVSGSVTGEDTIATILVNKDDANPTEGITGLGQATNLTIADINFNAKLLDDITVSDPWTPIMTYPSGVRFNGDKKTITFENNAIKNVACNEDYGPFITTNRGTVENVTIKYNGKTKIIGGPTTPTDKYASVTVRVDGQKAEIGQAITGAEALAISCDGGKTYITLERGDDLATYRTELSNLKTVEPEEEPTTEEPTTEEPTTEEPNTEEPEPEYLEYDIYYVYEDENETISAAKLNKDNNFEVELNYVSVTYNMEYANTYSEGEDGELSEKVMAAVRVRKNADGTYTALEDYDAVLEAVSGHDVPSKSKNVIITVDGHALALNSDYTYTYDSTEKRGAIHVDKSKITGPMVITVKADSLEDGPSTKIILKTKGGSIIDPLWEKSTSDSSTYSQIIYEPMALPTAVSPINSSDSLQFEGWYTNQACSGQKVTMSNYTEGGTYTYYAKYTIKNVTNANGSMWYNYGKSNMDVMGYYNGGYKSTSYSNQGFHPYYKIGTLTAPMQSGADYSGTKFSFSNSVGADAFVPTTNNIYVAQSYSFDGVFINVSYVFENRGTTDVNNYNFGLGTDIQVNGVDSAAISIVNEANSSYLLMVGNGMNFRTYIKGARFGVDDVTRYWYGYYGSSYNTNGNGWSYNVFNNGGEPRYDQYGGDSAMGICWSIDKIPAGGVVTKNIKVGIGDATSLSKLSTTFKANNGLFASNGSDSLTVVSNNKDIKVLADGRICVDGNKYYEVPTRTGYKLAYWSYTDGNFEDNPAPPKFTGAIEANSTLYAVWYPKPDMAVTNNSSIQKVEGNNDLIVPEEVGNIVITNTTAGVDEDKRVIRQGETQTDSAGLAAGFSGIISIEGADDRYLLPDDIKVEVVNPDTGERFGLTNGTGYVYELWNNRKKANIEIRKTYIKDIPVTGDLVITAIGYELPPVTATSVSASAKQITIGPDDTATFIAEAQTSKNHTATYQWYIAPYYKSGPFDGEYFWNYQNQGGTALSNGDGQTYTFATGEGTNKTVTIDVSGANKPTLRIKGLDVNPFTTNASVTPDDAARAAGLHLGGYHVYCTVTSVRNITGQAVSATSYAAEVEVTTGTYAAPTGIEGSATSYYGSTDGIIEIEKQTRPAMEYKKSTASVWQPVQEASLTAGRITGLAAGTYDFRYKGDTNHTASSITQVVVPEGKYIIVTYKAAGADDEDKRTQLKHVKYNSTVSDATPSEIAADGTIVKPAKTGYTFSRWEPASISNITENKTVEAVYTNDKYTLTLDNGQATTSGTTTLYEKYSDGFYTDTACTTASKVNGSIPITVPTKKGYIFKGYYKSAGGGDKMISADGRLTENMTATTYAANATLYAIWEALPVMMSVRETVDNPVLTNPSGGVTMKVLDSEGEEVKTTDGYDPNTVYTIKIDAPQDECNKVYAYSDGEYVKEIEGVSFTSSRVDYKNVYSTTFELKPSDIGGNNIVFVVAKVADGTDIQTQAEENEYTITYKEYNSSKNGAEFSGTFLDVAPVKGMNGLATPLPNAEKTGYTFGGWYTNVWCTGLPITEIPMDNTKNITVYAKWNPMKYSITLVENGGTYADDLELPTQYTHGGVNVVLPTATQISRTNYDFTGWYDNADLNGTPVTSIDASQVGAVTYYAGWQLKALHTVTLSNDGVSGKIYKIESVDGYTTSVYHGDDYKFTVDVASAYGIKAVKRDGKLLRPDEDGVYTVDNVIDDTSITVTCELLASTTDNDGEALIELSDGTTGYFDTVEDAIDYAAKHGDNSVIKLRKNIVAADIDAIAGRDYTIDLCGYNLGIGATMLIEPGANVTLTDSESDSPIDVEVENKGEFSNSASIAKVKNYGILNNSGSISAMEQGESDDGSITKTVDSGTIASAVLNSGYLVAEGSSAAPTGLSGHTTIMNGNEYYHDFNDAVTIAKNADDDSTILMLGTVDNNGKTLELGNNNGKKITIDLNNKNFENGTINITGDIEFVNGAETQNKITSEINIGDAGKLTVGNAVKTEGNIVNNGALEVCHGATTSANITNNAGATIDNNGNITSAVANSGKITNNADGVMNNVTQSGGRTYNHGKITTAISLTDGSYTYYAEANASPRAPEGTVVKVVEQNDPLVETYYPSVKTAVDDANDPTVEKPSPFVIEVLTDVPDLGGSPIVLDPTVPTVIELDGHELGDGSGDTIQIGDGTGGGSEVTFNGPGTVKSDVNVKPDGDVVIGGGDGTGTENNIEVTGTFTNNGNTENNGKLDDVVQQGGTMNNGPDGEIENLTQTGGNTDNEGEIGKAVVYGGGYEGDEPTDTSGSNVGKVAIIEGAEGADTYFADLDSALEYAATHGGLTVKLINDISGETISLTSDGSATLDLNGKKIGAGSSLAIDSRRYSLDIKNGTVEAPISTSGAVTVENDAIVNGDITVNATDSARVDNNGTVGKVTSSGEFNNAKGATAGAVTINGGTTVNSGTCNSAMLSGGCYEYNKSDDANPTPQVPSGAGVRLTLSTDPLIERYYSELATAIDDIDADAQEPVTVEVIDDITLPDTPATVIGGDKDIILDLGGHTIDGGTLEIGGNVEIEDDTTPKGTIESDITVDTGADLELAGVNVDGEITNNGKTTVDEDTTVTGEITNNGVFDNDGDISGNVANNGTFDNSGDISGEVTQSSGTFTNEEGGEVNKINQSGGGVVNKGTVDSANVSGGDYRNEGTGSTEAEDHTGARVSITRDGETTYYENVNDAISHAESGDVIKLLEDIGGEKPAEDIVVGVEGITIDLNGHSIKPDSSITVEEGGSITEIMNGDPNSGEITAPITNNGELTLDENVKVDTIINNGTLTNNGEIEELTNNGEAVNNGTIDTANQEKGRLVNNGTIDEVTLDGGGFSGNAPTTDIPDSEKKVQVGDSYYGDLESAIKAANEADEDVTIILYDDQTITDGTQIGNVNGNNIIIDTNGHDVNGDPTFTGAVTLDDSSDDPGTWNGDMTVNNPASLTISENTTVDGDIDNNYEIENSGHITGSIDNGGLVINDGGIIGGDVDNDVEGMFENNYIDEEHPGLVQGDVNNKGIFENNGIVNDVNNSGEGSFENTGTVDGDVTNSGTAVFENDATGSVGGQFTNKDSAEASNDGSINQLVVSGGEVTNGDGGDINQITQSGGNVDNEGNIDDYTKTNGTTENSGSIGELNQSGGSTENTGKIEELTQTGGSTDNDGGEIESAKITNGIGNYTGEMPINNEPGSNLDDVGAAVTSTDPATGKTTTRYYDDLDDAIAAAVSSGETDPLIEVKDSPATITSDTTIPEGMTIKVPEGTTLIIPDDVTVDNKGNIDNKGDIENNGTLTNEGTLDNSGELVNNGTVVIEENANVKNTGDISNTSDDSKVENKGTLDNGGGTINGNSGGAGQGKGEFVNSGAINGGSVTGPLENTEDGIISKPSVIAGEVKNDGNIVITKQTDVTGSDIENGEKGKVEVYIPPVVIPPTEESKPDSQEEDDDSTVPVIAAKEVAGVGELLATIVGTDTQTQAQNAATEANADNTDSTIPTVNILEQKGITEEEVLELVASDSEDAKQQVKELLKEAADAGNVVFDNPGGGSGTAGGNGGNQAGKAGTVQIKQIDNIAEMMDEILTPQEKVEVLKGTPLSIFGEVEEENKEFDDETKGEIERLIPEGSGIKAAIKVKLFKAIGDNVEEINSKLPVTVSYEIPKEYLEDGSAETMMNCNPRFPFVTRESRFVNEAHFL